MAINNRIDLGNYNHESDSLKKRSRIILHKKIIFQQIKIMGDFPLAVFDCF